LNIPNRPQLEAHKIFFEPCCIDLPNVALLRLVVALICLWGADRLIAQTAPATAPISDFKDIAGQAGLTANNVYGGVDTKKYILETTGNGVAIFDYDNDGWPDIFFVNGSRLGDSQSTDTSSNRLYHNNHDGTFTDVTKKAGLRSSGWGQGACVGDYDNDGWDDLYVTYYGKNRLYHNNHGVFSEVAEQSGVAGYGKEWGSGCAFLDYNRDGRVDLFVANYVQYEYAASMAPGNTAACLWKGAPVMCGPRGLPGTVNRLYENIGEGKFADVTHTAHIDKSASKYCFSPTTLDYDDDGWPDIYVACDSAPSALYHNNRDGTFTDDAAQAGVAYNDDGREQAGMGVTIADYDGDGQLDIFKTNFSDDTPTLYHNDGSGIFSEVTIKAGLAKDMQYLGWGTMFFDFDNDGWPDLILANGHVYPEVDKFHLGSDYREPRKLYHNQGDGTFADISAQAGAGVTAPLPSRGLAVGDLWNDGHVSAVISNMNAGPSLLVNRVKSSNHWIGLRLVGTNSNHDGIGSKVTVHAGKRVLVDEVRSGSSYISQSDMRLHFGLGNISTIDSIEVRWPNGIEERFVGIAADGIRTLTEGRGTVLKH
jgi:hypothetical protein